MPLTQGQVLNNRYRIVRLLGQGGFGAVYRAWDMNLNIPVALKENLNVTPEAVRQFEREARFLASLRHEGLPFVIDHFSLANQGQYMVMQYIEGNDLQQLLDQNPSGLPEAQVLPWFEQVCEALIYLHQQSPPVIHRDIKPANIKITPEGRAVLVDFGIAKQYKPGHQTTVGARAVTQGFSPPEQYGGGSTDIRSDIYSLGATLYAALTGKIPTDSLQRSLGAQFLTPRQLNPNISPHLEQAILRAMEPDPQHRFQQVSEFRRALQPPVSVRGPAVAVQSPPAMAATRVAAPSQAASFPAAPPEAPQRYKASVPDYGAPPSYVPSYGDREPPYAEEYTPPASTRRPGWLWPAVIAFLAVCLVGGAIGAAALYAAGYWPGGTPPAIGGLAPTFTPQVASATVASSSLPTSSPTSLLPPSPVPTTQAPPTLPPTWTPWPSATFTPTPALQATWSPCAGTYPSRLHVGMTAMVSYNPPLANRVRSEPNTTTDNIVGLLQPGEKMEILEGPVCSQGWIWWRVRSLSTGLTGWTAEGDASSYWLEPVP